MGLISRCQPLGFCILSHKCRPEDTRPLPRAKLQKQNLHMPHQYMRTCVLTNTVHARCLFYKFRPPVKSYTISPQALQPSSPRRSSQSCSRPSVRCAESDPLPPPPAPPSPPAKRGRSAATSLRCSAGLSLAIRGVTGPAVRSMEDEATRLGVAPDGVRAARGVP